MKFSIVTPSINRSTLLRTIQSVKDNAGDCDYEHIIAFDGKVKLDPVALEELIKKYPNVQILLQEETGDFANRIRAKANEMATGDYVMYLDDDDYFINNTLPKVQAFIESMPFLTMKVIVFPCLRFNQIFYNLPPRNAMTVSCQYFHKRIIGDKLIKFGECQNGVRVEGYSADGIWIEDLVKTYGYNPMFQNPTMQDCLSKVDLASGGASF